jgi:hypothetical protein
LYKFLKFNLFLIMKSKSLIKILPILIFLFASYFVYTLIYVPYQQEKEIEKNGIVATGKLVEIVETGNTFNDKPELKLKFEVTNAKGDRWFAETTKVFSFLDIPKLAIGTILNLKYNPKDKTQVIINEDYVLEDTRF